MYLGGDGGRLDLSSVPTVADVKTYYAGICERHRTAGGTGPVLGDRAAGHTLAAEPKAWLDELKRLGQADLGALLGSSRPLSMTEPDTEFVVTCVKHVFSRALVLQVPVPVSP